MPLPELRPSCHSYLLGVLTSFIYLFVCFVLYVWVLCLACKCAMDIPGAWEGLKRLPDSQELELLMVVGHHWGVGIEPGSSIIATIMLNCWSTSLAPSHTYMRAQHDPFGEMFSEHCSPTLIESGAFMGPSTLALLVQLLIFFVCTPIFLYLPVYEVQNRQYILA